MRFVQWFFYEFFEWHDIVSVLEKSDQKSKISKKYYFGSLSTTRSKPGSGENSSSRSALGTKLSDEIEISRKRIMKNRQFRGTP